MLVAKKRNFLNNNKKYTELEYIQSSGTQYIDTGIKSSLTGRWEMKVNAFGTNRRFIGVENQIVVATPNSVTTFYPYYYNGWKDYSGSVDITTANEVTFDFTSGSQKLSVNGVTAYTSSSTTSFTPANIYVFNYNGVESTYFKSIAFYWLKMYDENYTLVRDYIAVKDSDGVVCMYDKVSEQFFYNQGTGDFIAGPVK